MAKPENTLYELRAQMPSGEIRGVNKTPIMPTWALIGSGDILEGHDAAIVAVTNLQEAVKKSHEKGHRPRFFIKKTKPSELVNRQDWSSKLNNAWCKQHYSKQQIAPMKVLGVLMNSKQ